MSKMFHVKHREAMEALEGWEAMSRQKMAFLDLFKTKAERKAYAKGRKDQYNKEHPKLKWGI